MPQPPTQVVPFVGFAPDVDPQTPGIWLSCDKFYPTLKGFRATQGPMTFMPVLNKQVIGAFRARYLDGTERLFAGTEDALYGSVSQLWDDVSRVGGYTASNQLRWRFDQFGNHILTTDGVDDVQMSPQGSDFDDLAGSPPKAQIVVVVNNFVFLLNTEVQEDQWWCSGIGDDTAWTPDIATQSANALLTDTYGAITAGHKLGRDLIVYKLRSMYILQYEGPPIIWGSQLLSAETGAPGQEAVVEMADMHVFVGYNDFYIYNGGRPQALQSPLREFFFQQSLDQNFANRIIGRWDKPNGVVVWHYPSVNADPPGSLDTWVAWHTQANHWTMGTRDIEYALQSDIPLSTGITYDEAGDTIITYDSGSPLTYDTLFPNAVAVGYQALFLPDHGLYTLNGDREASTFTTGDVGLDLQFTYLTRVKPKFSIYPVNIPRDLLYGNAGSCYGSYQAAGGTSNTYSNVASCLADRSSLTEMYKTNLGDTLTTGQTVFLAGQGWYNVRRASRFHRFTVTFPADVEIIGYEPVIRQSGAR